MPNVIIGNPVPASTCQDLHSDNCSCRCRNLQRKTEPHQNYEGSTIEPVLIRVSQSTRDDLLPVTSLPKNQTAAPLEGIEPATHGLGNRSEPSYRGFRVR